MTIKAFAKLRLKIGDHDGLGSTGWHWSRRKLAEPVFVQLGNLSYTRTDERVEVTDYRDAPILRTHARLCAAWRKLPHTRRLIMINGEPVLEFRYERNLERTEKK